MKTDEDDAIETRGKDKRVKVLIIRATRLNGKSVAPGEEHVCSYGDSRNCIAGHKALVASSDEAKAWKQNFDAQQKARKKGGNQ